MAAPAIAGIKKQPLEIPAQRFYRPELDCLRFFAFFGVFVCHTLPGDPSYYEARHVPLGTFVARASFAGRYGVDLFFLLSAYLITELLLREREQFGELALRSFYLRRILRIWPLYFLGILIGFLLPFMDSQQQFPLKYASAFALMVGNWLVSWTGGVPSVMSPLWSVSFEEQFYLLWPAFISRARGRALLWACAVLVIIASISRLLLLEHARHIHEEMAIFTNSLARLDPLAFGIATAVLLRGKRLRAHILTRIALALAGSGLWIAASYYCGLNLPYIIIGYPVVAAGAWLIFVSAMGLTLTPIWLRYLGKISYGLYVFHGIGIYFALQLFGGSVHSLKVFAAYWCFSLALTIGMAALSYRFFESPFLRLKERFARVMSRPV